MIKLGVVGVGVIGTAMVKGLKKKYGDDIEIFLSPRNTAKAEGLAKAFSGVTVMGSNQEVLDAADWIIFSVLPAVAEETARSLAFAPRHKVISLISKAKIADLTEWMGPTALLCRVIPQTFIEFHTGPMLLYPGLPEAHNILSGMGQVVMTDTEEAFILAQVLSCVTGPFFYLQDQIIQWMDGLGLPPEQSAPFLFGMFSALCDYANRTNPREIDELWKEVTPGGLNEMAYKMIDKDGCNESWLRALEAVRQRIV